MGAVVADHFGELFLSQPMGGSEVMDSGNGFFGIKTFHVCPFRKRVGQLRAKRSRTNCYLTVSMPIEQDEMLRLVICGSAVSAVMRPLALLHYFIFCSESELGYKFQLDHLSPHFRNIKDQVYSRHLFATQPVASLGPFAIGVCIAWERINTLIRTAFRGSSSVSDVPKQPMSNRLLSC
jgi:hypothetical protein